MSNNTFARVLRRPLTGWYMIFLVRKWIPCCDRCNYVIEFHYLWQHQPRSQHVKSLGFAKPSDKPRIRLWERSGTFMINLSKRLIEHIKEKFQIIPLTSGSHMLNLNGGSENIVTDISFPLGLPFKTHQSNNYWHLMKWIETVALLPCDWKCCS